MNNKKQKNKNIDKNQEEKDIRIEDKTEMSDDEKVIVSLQKEVNELKDRLIRKTAELDNVIKRCEKEKLDMIDYANERLILKLLELVDDMDKAVEVGKESHDSESILTGVEMIYAKAKKLLDDEGVKVLESSVGKPFDVNLHDAILQMPSEHPEGNVVQEIQKGYSLRDKVIRHSKVITSSGVADGRKENNNE